MSTDDRKNDNASQPAEKPRQEPITDLPTPDQDYTDVQQVKGGMRKNVRSTP